MRTKDKIYITEVRGILFSSYSQVYDFTFYCYKYHTQDVCQSHYMRTMHGRVENKPSPLWAVGNGHTWPAIVLRCAWCLFNTAVSKVFQRTYQKKSIFYGCQMKLCAVCSPEHESCWQLFIRINMTESLYI